MSNFSLFMFFIKPLKSFFNKQGMELIDVEDNPTKGGSMRCTLQLIGGNRQINKSVENHIKLEEKEGFQTQEIMKSYNKRIENSKNEFKNLFSKLLDKNNVIAGYGASATSTTLIYHYNMGKYLSYLVDDFTAKHKLYSPGFHIPVYASEYLYKKKPNYVVILAWRYAEKIINKNKKYLDEGGKFIIPLPKIKIIE